MPSSAWHAQYIYEDSKLLVPLFCFAELIQAGSRTVWSEQNALYPQFLPTPARNKPSVKTKE